MKALLLLAFACGSTPSQHSTGSVGIPAAPTNLTMSCDVNGDERSAKVTITNRTDVRRYFRWAVPRFDYEVIVTAPDGKPLPPPQPSPGQAWGGSAGPVPVDPGAAHIESFSLSDLVAIPSNGGKFKVRIGRGLFPYWEDPTGSIPQKFFGANRLT